MAKDSILIGAVNDSDFKNKGTEATLSVVKNGERGPRLINRTSSPNAQNEVTKVQGFEDLQKPTKR